MSKNYFRAIATLVGTIVGVGMFAVPYVISKAGIILFLIYLPILATVQHYLHKLYAEIILSTREKHRLPGYSEKYFNKHGKKLTLTIVLLGNYGTLVAYVIIGGVFLNQLLSPVFGGSVFLYTTILFIIESLVILMDLRFIAFLELSMTILLFLAIGFITFRGFPYIDFSNYILVDWKYTFLPYGPIFFSVGGGVAIPEVCKLLAHKKENIKSALFWGTFIAVAVLFVFTILVVGITGANTTAGALVGLNLVITNGVMTTALIFGLLTIITSFLVVANAVKEIYWWDLGINKNVAWILACAIPYFLYLIGLQNLTKVVSLTGAITGGAIGIILIYLALQVKRIRKKIPAINNKLSKTIVFILSLLFVLGFIYEIWQIFK
ncbi:MAG: aromatic amino acid transport family protein [Candidatus Falkowbacteria bacterium]